MTSDAVHMTDVYAWRQDQETALRASKGMSMSDEQVIRFVDGCMISSSSHSARWENNAVVR